MAQGLVKILARCLVKIWVKFWVKILIKQDNRNNSGDGNNKGFSSVLGAILVIGVDNWSWSSTKLPMPPFYVWDAMLVRASRS